jgi:hypothetical protein
MRGLTIEQVADLTKLSPRVLRQIETGHFEALPQGIHGRAHIRAYVRAVGIEDEETVAALVEQLPAAPDALDGLRARARRQFAADHPLAAAVAVRTDALRRRAGAAVRDAIQHAARPRQVPSRQPPLIGAVIVDLAILTAATGTMILLGAWLTETGVRELWMAAPWPLAASCLLTTASYATVAHGLGGRSVGVITAAWLSQARAQPRRESDARVTVTRTRA